jgi:RND superfamily putative drug exporter
MLLAASVLSLVAPLGVTTWVFNIVEPSAGLVFYVPFAVAMPQTTRSIAAAGLALALAASFGMLALVPLSPFRQLAFAVGVGIALDVLVVRSLLMPALLAVLGPASAWAKPATAHDPRALGLCAASRSTSIVDLSTRSP